MDKKLIARFDHYKTEYAKKLYLPPHLWRTLILLRPPPVGPVYFLSRTFRTRD